MVRDDLQAQLASTVKLCRGMRVHDDVCCLPRGIASVNFVGETGTLKSAEYLLLAGPYIEYLLEGCFALPVQAVVFKFLDLLGLLWVKTISQDTLTMLEERIPIVLTQLQILLPAWELNMNRHTLLHLKGYGVAIRCWTWPIFGMERLWKHLTDWMTQKSHPEGTMLNAHNAFKSACIALQEVSTRDTR